MKYIFIDPPHYDGGKSYTAPVVDWLAMHKAARPVEWHGWHIKTPDMSTYRYYLRVEFFDYEEELMTMFALAFSEYVYAVTDSFEGGVDPRG